MANEIRTKRAKLKKDLKAGKVKIDVLLLDPPEWLGSAKVFDIILTMTNGQWSTNTLANLMFDWMFRGGGDFGRGATIAIIIMLAVVPIMIWNIRHARSEEGGH